MPVESQSFIALVYPFLFDGADFASLAASCTAARWRGRSALWEECPVPIEELVQHVGDFLVAKSRESRTSCHWRLAGDARQSLEGLGAHTNVQWLLCCGGRQIAFAIETIELCLYEGGVGFLTLWVRPQSAANEDWLDLLHHARFTRRKDSGTIHIQRRTGFDKTSSDAQFEPYFPAIAGGTTEHRDGHGTLADVVEALLMSVKPGSLPWWMETFIYGQLIPYAGLFFRNVPREQHAEMLYRVQNFFHARQEIHASTDDLSGASFARIPYAEGQGFLFSLDGGAFVGFDAPSTPFFREQLPAHLANQYFLICELVLYQRFLLLSLSERVARHWAWHKRGKQATREAGLRQIRQDLLAFTAQSFFTQAMQREHHQRCYARWQEVLQIEKLHAGVSGEVHSIHEYLLLEKAEGLEQRVNLMTVVLAPPALVLAVLQTVGTQSWLIAGASTLLALAIGGWVWWQYFRQR